MTTIEVDGKKLEVDSDSNLLDACLSHSLDLPYFCWHPAMGSVGSCRQCAVKVYANEEDQRGRILMACMTPVQDGMRLSIEEPGVSQFRDKSIEVTMANHPHDCPVCEEGGECHLQDMTIMSDHTTRRHRGEKKTYKNQYLGPCIGHEMNRCIACYRCVRFYNDYAGGEDLSVMASRENVYFGRHEEGTLESVFSGNLVEVCPTGVFTDKTLARSYTRKWDLQSAPSICEGCSLGCNITPSERYGKIKRIVNRYHHDINGYFLCDKGRFAYDHVNHQSRVEGCLSVNKSTNEKIKLPYDEAIALSAELLSDIDTAKVFGVGSDRASVEENVLLQQLVGEESFCSGLSQTQHQVNQQILAVLHDPDIATPTMKELEDCDAVLVLGEDLLNTAPRLALSVRQATRNFGKELAKQARIPLWQDASVRTIAQDQRSPLIIISSAATDLDEIASKTIHLSPDTIAQLGQSIAQAIDGLHTSGKDQDAEQIANVLLAAKNPLVISGASQNSVSVVNAAAQIAKALGKKSNTQGKCLQVPLAVNSMGLALTCGESGCNLEQVFNTVTGNAGQYSLLVLQNDLLSLGPTKTHQLLSASKRTLVIEQHHTTVTEQADLLIPAKAIMETEGSFVNNEGRAQRFYEVFDKANSSIKDNWKSLINLARAQCNRAENKRLDRIAELNVFDDVVNFLADLGGNFQQWRDIAPDSHLRIAGMKVPRQSHRFSGRTSIHANTKVAENKQTQDEDSALAFSMEGAQINVPSSLNALIWSPGWNSNEAINKFQDEVGGHLKGDGSGKGDPGVRVIGKGSSMPDVNSTSDSIALKPNQLLAVSAARIFDGDRRIAMSVALLQRAPLACGQLCAKTASRFGVDSNQRIKISMAGDEIELNVVVNDSVPMDTLLIPNTVFNQQKLAMATLPAAVEVQAL